MDLFARQIPWPGSLRLVVYGACLFAGIVAFASVSGCVAQPPPEDAPADQAREEAQREHLASRGFYQRRATGNGWFLTRSDPEVARSRTLSDVLRTVPGVNVIRQGGGALVVSNRQPGRCSLAVFVDGSYTTIRNVDELTLEDIAAIEVYRGPSEVPLSFTAPPYDGTCGALLVWSRIELGDE